ncbi:MAG TPA: hypothetical protein VF655_01465 [Allosphingosinicella sp.]|jgi:hypothetical protein
MSRILRTLILALLAASCSGGEEGPRQEAEARLCTSKEAGAAAAAKATELLDAVRQGKGAARDAACARFREVIADGRKAGIADASDCRFDDRNSNGNPRFLISLHLTQLKGQARKLCGKLD